LGSLVKWLIWIAEALRQEDQFLLRELPASVMEHLGTTLSARLGGQRSAGEW